MQQTPFKRSFLQPLPRFAQLEDQRRSGR